MQSVYKLCAKMMHTLYANSTQTVYKSHANTYTYNCVHITNIPCKPRITRRGGAEDLVPRERASEACCTGGAPRVSRGVWQFPSVAPPRPSSEASWRLPPRHRTPIECDRCGPSTLCTLRRYPSTSRRTCGAGTSNPAVT